MRELLDIAGMLDCCHFRYCSEKELQDGIALFFDRSCMVHIREHRLTPRDRPDFMVGAELQIAVEVKIKGAAASVVRQLERYAAHPDVAAVLLITTRSLQALQIPDEMNGKPVRVVCLRSL